MGLPICGFVLLAQCVSMALNYGKAEYDASGIYCKRDEDELVVVRKKLKRPFRDRI